MNTATLKLLCDRFYRTLATLERHGQGMPLRSYNGRSGLPSRGVYFFREPGEQRSDSQYPRIVRVGTHALADGAKSTLWGRLRTHMGTKSGSGNHRGSIFRLHVGAALLERDRRVVTSWGQGASKPQTLRSDPAATAAEAEVESAVSAYIGSMSILWVDVPDEPSASSQRGFIERNAIALLSNQFQPQDAPSTDWLGRYSRRREVRMSGLWNVNHVEGACDPAFLDSLEALAQRAQKKEHET
jgi:hypothetical protein